MNTNVNYVTVGIFVIVLTVSAIAGVLWLSAGFGGVQYNDYVAYVSESVSGLNTNAPVKYRGVDVGFVREIGLRPDNPQEVRLLMAIEDGTPVKEDSVAILSVQGLTGIAFIDLTGGTKDSPLLRAAPGAAYPEIQTGPSLLARLDAAASQMFTNIESVSDSMSAFLNEDNQRAFREALDSIRDFTVRLETVLDDENARRLGESRESLHRISTTLAANTEEFERIVGNMAEGSDRLPETVAGLEEMGASLKGAGDQFSATMRDTQSEVRYLSQQLAPNAAEALDDLRSVSAKLDRFISELERDPALLLHGRRTERKGPGEG